jgi:lysophospholipase L1-like esterase
LVTITIGGNDVGYIPLLMAAALPRPARRLPLLGTRIGEMLDRDARDRALAEVFDSLCAVGKAVRERAPQARAFFVDYAPASGRCPQTMLPPAGVSAAPLSQADAELGRHVAATLERLTADAASATGCEVAGAAAASRQHHAWSAEPWTTTPAKYIVPLPGRPAPLHPNSSGMRSVAEVVAAQL